MAKFNWLHKYSCSTDILFTSNLFVKVLRIFLFYVSFRLAMGRGKLTLQTKFQIQSLFENGFSQREIARRLNVSQKCVFDIVQKMKKNYL